MSHTNTSSVENGTEKQLAAGRPQQAAQSATGAVEADGWPLSFAQQRLWLLEELEPGTALYNIPTAVRLRGALNTRALEEAFNVLVTRHESLRTRFICRDEHPEQIIDETGVVTLRREDVSQSEAGKRQEQVERFIREEINRTFDLSFAPLLRAMLIKVAPEEHVMVITIHHIVADEWSVRILFRELGEAYGAVERGERPQFPELAVQYADFAVWQRNELEGEALDGQLAHWKDVMRGSPPVLEFATDAPRTATPTFRGTVLSRNMGPEVAAAVKELARKEGGTSFMVLLAAFQALVHRYTGQEDVVLATPVAARNRIETESLIGFFVNTLPVRASVNGDKAFRELVKQAKQSTLSLYANQDVPFQKLVETLQPERSLSHLPFTRIMFLTQSGLMETMQWGGVAVEFLEAETDTSKFELTFGVQETSKGLIARAEFNTDLFHRDTIERLLGHYENLLRGAVSAPNKPVSQLPMLSTEEWRQIVVDWNRTSTDCERSSGLATLFERQVAKTPRAVAISYGEQKFTYRELNERANQLAHYLTSYGVGVDAPVAVCMKRSLDMVVSILAIVKAGGGYVPLDPDYPAERLVFMAQDSGAALIITHHALLSRLPGATQRISLDTDWELVARQSRENPVSVNKGDDLAYLMYTSGSTGQPKGVAVPHRGIIRLVRNTNYIRFEASDRVAHVSNVSFDAATFEMWGALLNGAKLVVIGSDILLSPADFARELKQRKITAMFLTAAMFNQMVAEAPEAFKGLRTLIAGGEALDPESVRTLLRNHPPERLLNGYGPTENTTFTCCHWIQSLPDEATNVPIGKPIANTTVYILDANRNPVPIGVAGELYTGGDGLARGYWHRPELTATKFVENPFKEHDPSPVLYRTGDLTRYLPNGEVEFVGRIDEQVKVRGFRIELGEIESVLRKHPGVRDCVARVWGSNAHKKTIVAYVVPSRSSVPSVTELRGFLREHVPDYMLPSAFVSLEQLPVTANGKVNRAALPAPDQARPELSDSYCAPRDDIETKLAGIWEKVLGVSPVGIYDRFFDLGGHSLLAVKLVAQIEKAFARKLKLATIFQAQTIDELALILREEIKESAVTASSALVAIQPRGTKPPLFLVHGAGGGMFWGYMNLSRHLGTEQPVYAFRSRALDGRAEFERLEEMAADYVRDLKALQPKGPYHLGGYCFGGNVAFEMARQLEASGDTVALLLMLNCAPPNSSYTNFKKNLAWGARFAKNLVYWGRYFSQWTESQRREFFQWKLKRWKARIMPERAAEAEPGAVDVGDMVDLSSFSPEERTAWEAHIRGMLRYRPGQFSGRVELIRSPGHPLWCSFAEDYGWRELAKGGVGICRVAGAHEKILEEPCVQEVARCVQRVLENTLQKESTKCGKENHNEPIKARNMTSGGRTNGSGDVILAGGGGSERVLTVDHRAVAPDRNGNHQLLGSRPALMPLSEHVDYWKNHLKGAAALLELPTDNVRPAKLGNQVAERVLTLEREKLERVLELARHSGVELSDVLLTSVAVLLSRYSRQEDIVIGVQADGGPITQVSAVEENLVIVRVGMDAAARGSETMTKVAKVRAEAEEHAGISSSDLVAELGIEQDPSYHPICQVAFSFGESNPRRSRTPDGSVARPPFDLNFRATKTEQGLCLGIEFAAELYEPPTVERMLNQWKTLLHSLCIDPEVAISRLEILPAEEKRLLLEDWNSTTIQYPKGATLVDLFWQQAEKTPDVCALVCGDRRLTYRELAARAAYVAHELCKLGVGHEDLVGICLERRWEMVVSILGALRAGAAYVPMDPAYPKERLGFIVEDAKLKVLITQGKLQATVPPTAAQTLIVDKLEWPTRDVTLEPCPAKGSSLGYVIYTSGSTGKPKGVALEHGNAVALVAWAQTVFTPEQLDGVLYATSMCFDLSIFEMFVPLCSGGKVILAENALALPTLAAAGEVRMINTVPSAMRELVRLNGVPDSVKVINLAGEPLPTSLVDQIYERTKVEKVYDLYGPTETTTYSTYTLRLPGKRATIGKPLANEQVYLLDSHKQLVPVGVPGELYIAGDGVTRGYLNRPEMTAERFLDCPFRPGTRMYRTGDLARWRADGNIEYLGRLDHQVKIRGFRIELGEIETALKKCPDLADAVVVAREDSPGQKRLAAYVVRKPDSEVKAENLRQAIRKNLPEYMVPAAFVFLPALPLTPNGKVDRKALPVPEYERDETAGEFVEARSATEQRLSIIWQEVLGLKQVGVRDNFFDLGGNSLLAIQVISRIREQFGVMPPISSLFNAPTVEQLAKALESGEWASLDASVPALQPIGRNQPLPVSSVQERLWFLEQLNPGTDAYNVPAAFELEGKLDVPALTRALNAVVERHEALRTSFAVRDEVLSQVIAERLQIPIERLEPVKSSGNGGASRVPAGYQAVNQFVQRAFDLQSGPLIRAGLVALEPERHIFAVVMHHAVADGWSLGILFRELRELYSKFANGAEQAALPELRIQYADFAAWKKQWMSDGALARELSFWKEHLSGAPQRTELPSDFDGPAGQLLGRCVEILPADVSKGMRELSQRSGCTVFTQLMAALGATLKRWTAQEDLVVGTVVAGRSQRETESLIGCFMNFLPVRLRLGGVDTLEGVLARTRESILQSQNHQECPFEKIVEAINPERRMNQNPLYNVALLLQNFPLDTFQTRELKAKAIPVGNATALLDLRFEAEEVAEGLKITCEYRTGMFKPETIGEVMRTLVGTVSEQIKSPERKLADLAPVGNATNAGRGSRKEPIDKIGIAGTFTTEPIEESLQYWFSELGADASVEFAPYNQVFQQLLDPAGVFGRNKSGLNVILVRLEDWRRQGQHGQSQETREGETLERTGAEFVNAIKAGLAKSSVPILVVICPPSPAVTRDTQRAELYSSAEAQLKAQIQPIAGAYFVSAEEVNRLYRVEDYYDSSGDELGHVPYTPMFYTALGTIVARKYNALRRPPYKVVVLDCDNTLWSGVCGEDGPQGIRLEQGFMALQKFMREQQAVGMLLCVCSKNNEQDVREVFAQRLEMPLRHEHFAAWRTNWKPKSENLKSLAKELNLGLDSLIFLDDNPVEIAEVSANCPQALALQLPSRPEDFENFLTHCWAFDHLKVTAEDQKRGELYRQNIQREQLRSEAGNLADFIASLDLTIRIERMTPEQLPRVAQLTQRTNQFNFTTRRRTESEVQQLPATAEVLTVSVTDRFGDYGLTGVIIYEQRGTKLAVDTFLLSCRVLGRGVEHRMLARLGEIAKERRLNCVDVHFSPTAKNQPGYDFLDQIGAPFRQGQNGGYLFRFPAGFAAEVTFNPQLAETESERPKESQPSISPAKPVEIRGALPRKFAKCHEIAMGFGNAAAIHANVEGRQKTRVVGKTDYAAPRNPLEKQLCELWQKLLHVERVGIRDNFFELGGHSLLAVRLFAEIEKLTGSKLPLVTLFQSPTVRELAKAIKQQSGPGKGALIVPLQPNGSKPPLFLIHGAGGDVLWGYANLGGHLSADQPLYGVRSRGQLGQEEPRTLREMASTYIDEIRAVQPKGPYFIGGYCFGGNVAYEMARQLKERGETVEVVVLLDSAPMNAGYENTQWWNPVFLYRFARNVSYWLADFAELDRGEQRRWVARKVRAYGRKLVSPFRRHGAESVDLEDVIDLTHFPAKELRLWQAHLDALVAHVDQPYSGRVLLMRTRGQPMFCSLRDDFCWGHLVGAGLEVERIPGSHENIFMEPNVKELAARLGRKLDECQQKPSHAERRSDSNQKIAA
jgi:amino acid adenylation domain-containing protein/FkbH-like protein